MAQKTKQSDCAPRASDVRGEEADDKGGEAPEGERGAAVWVLEVV